MATMTRKQVENYYEKEWSNFLSSGTVSLLVELTCQSYHLNQPQAQLFVRHREIPKPQALGKI